MTFDGFSRTNQKQTVLSALTEPLPLTFFSRPACSVFWKKFYLIFCFKPNPSPDTYWLSSKAQLTSKQEVLGSLLLKLVPAHSRSVELFWQLAGPSSIQTVCRLARATIFWLFHGKVRGMEAQGGTRRERKCLNPVGLSRWLRRERAWVHLLRINLHDMCFFNYWYRLLFRSSLAFTTNE